MGRLCSGEKRFNRANSIFADCFILRGRDTHIDFLRHMICPLMRAKAFSLTSFEMLSSSMRLNDGFRLFNLSKVPPGSE